LPVNDTVNDTVTTDSKSEWEDNKNEHETRLPGRVPRWQQKDYLSGKDTEYRDAVTTYTRYKQGCQKETLGTVRPLLPEEEEYFSFMAPIYRGAPLFKAKIVDWSSPPNSWLDRYQLLVPTSSNAIIDTIHLIAREACQDTPRFRWMEALSDLPPGVSRFVWCLMFCKATNGVSDVVVCKHFKLAIEKVGALSMEELIAKPLLIAQILRQTSKWAKNTVSALHSFCSIQSKYSHLHLSVRFSLTL
jgi:hypothetical protein